MLASCTVRPVHTHTCAVHQIDCELSSLAESAQLPGWSQDVLQKSIVKCLEISLLMKAEFTCESFMNSITSSLNPGTPLPVYTLQPMTRLQNPAEHSSHHADACRPTIAAMHGRREASITRNILNVVSHATHIFCGMPSAAHFISIEHSSKREEHKVVLVR